MYITAHVHVHVYCVHTYACTCTCIPSLICIYHEHLYCRSDDVLPYPLDRSSSTPHEDHLFLQPDHQALDEKPEHLLESEIIAHSKETIQEPYFEVLKTLKPARKSQELDVPSGSQRDPGNEWGSGLNSPTGSRGRHGTSSDQAWQFGPRKGNQMWGEGWGEKGRGGSEMQDGWIKERRGRYERFRDGDEMWGGSWGDRRSDRRRDRGRRRQDRVDLTTLSAEEWSTPLPREKWRES